MDSDGDDNLFDSDSGNETSDGEDVGVAMDPAVGGGVADPGRGCGDWDEVYQFEVLSTDQIVHHMNKCIEEVNTVVQLPSTTTRILLNHFRWDREKLYEA